MAFGQCPCWYFLYLSDLKVINLIFQSKILVLGYFGLKKTTKLSLSDPLALFIIYAMYSTTLICFLGRQCCEYNAFPYGVLLEVCRTIRTYYLLAFRIRCPVWLMQSAPVREFTNEFAALFWTKRETFTDHLISEGWEQILPCRYIYLIFIYSTYSKFLKYNTFWKVDCFIFIKIWRLAIFLMRVIQRGV